MPSRAVRVLFLVFAAPLLCAQARRPAPLRASTYLAIKVIDSDSHAGIEGAAVVVSGFYRRTKFERQVATNNEGVTGVTVASPGSYSISVQVDHYVTANGSSAAESIDVTPQDSSPKMTILIPMYHSSQVSGTLVDDETGEPVKGVHVAPLQSSFRRGVQQLARKQFMDAETGREGVFKLANLPPGDYVLEIGGGEPKTQPNADAPEAPKGFPLVLWPGTGDSFECIHIVSGSQQNTGVIRIKSGALPTLTIIVRAIPCEPASVYSVALSREFGPSTLPLREFRAKCDKPLAITGVSPGNYELVAASVADPESFNGTSAPVSGFATVVLDQDGLQAELPVSAPLQIGGQVVIDGQETNSNPVPIPPFKIRFSPQPNRDAPTLPVFEPASVSADGGFAGSVMLGVGRKVEVIPMGLSAQYTVARLVYNSSSFPGRIFQVSSSEMAHDLKVVLSSQPSRLIGKVNSSSEIDLSRVHVLVTPWPAETENSYPTVLTEAVASRDGLFQFSGMLAGSYRMLAVSEEDRARLEEPGTLLNLLAQTDSILIPSAAFTTATVKVTAY